MKFTMDQVSRAKKVLAKSSNLRDWDPQAELLADAVAQDLNSEVRKGALAALRKGLVSKNQTLQDNTINVLGRLLRNVRPEVRELVKPFVRIARRSLNLRIDRAERSEKLLRKALKDRDILQSLKA